jgi:hypothetical protein
MVDPKQHIREAVWRLLEQEGASRFPGARGRVPNFVGAEDAARQLALTPEWAGASVLKTNPDSPQLPVRARALAEGKVLYMAIPRLRDLQPFLLLDPAKLGPDSRRAASIGGAARLGSAVGISVMRRQGRRVLRPRVRAAHRGRPGGRRHDRRHDRSPDPGLGGRPSRDSARLPGRPDRDATGGHPAGAEEPATTAGDRVVRPGRRQDLPDSCP